MNVPAVGGDVSSKKDISSLKVSFPSVSTALTLKNHSSPEVAGWT